MTRYQSAKTAYNSAKINDYISVSVLDYNNVFSALSNAFKIGMTDPQFYEVGSGWAGTCANILPSNISSVPIDTYLIGYACYGTTPSTNTYISLISTIFKGYNYLR